jgi:hypothetical protein
MEAGPTCTALSDASVATTNFGNPEWACTQLQCPDLAKCAADCDCNNALLTALACTVDAGGATPTYAETLACFTPALTLIAGDTNVPMALAGCLVGAGSTCAGFDAGSDASTEAGSTDAGATDAGTTDAGSDAGSPEAGPDAALEAAAP